MPISALGDGTAVEAATRCEAPCHDQYEQKKQLWNTIRRLTATEQAVMILKGPLGTLNNRELADLLGTRESTVSARHKRARDSLRDRLDGHA